jgi:hypothetical protein
VLCTIWSGQTWTWPWVLALTPAMLGGGAGLGALISVVALAPGPDAHKRPDNPLEHGDTTGQANLMVWGGLVPGIPAGTLLGFGAAYDNAFLTWAAVPVGIVTGVLLTWWLGNVAVRRLEARGSEMLFLMRTGRTSKSVKIDVPKRAVWASISGWTLGSIALFPQGIVPMIVLLAGVEVKSWFLALYLPGALQWPGAAVMVLFGVWLYYIAIKATIVSKPSSPSAGNGDAAEPVGAPGGTPETQRAEFESV